jgi:hypothetical protein
MQPTYSCPIFATYISFTRLVHTTNFYETTPTSTALPTDFGAIDMGYAYSFILGFLRVYGIMTIFALNINTHFKNFSHKVYKHSL